MARRPADRLTSFLPTPAASPGSPNPLARPFGPASPPPRVARGARARGETAAAGTGAGTAAPRPGLTARTPCVSWEPVSGPGQHWVPHPGAFYAASSLEAAGEGSGRAVRRDASGWAQDRGGGPEWTVSPGGPRTPVAFLSPRSDVGSGRNGP